MRFLFVLSQQMSSTLLRSQSSGTDAQEPRGAPRGAPTPHRSRKDDTQQACADLRHISRDERGGNLGCSLARLNPHFWKHALPWLSPSLAPHLRRRNKAGERQRMRVTPRASSSSSSRAARAGHLTHRSTVSAVQRSAEPAAPQVAASSSARQRKTKQGLSAISSMGRLRISCHSQTSSSQATP